MDATVWLAYGTLFGTGVVCLIIEHLITKRRRKNHD